MVSVTQYPLCFRESETLPQYPVRIFSCSIYCSSYKVLSICEDFAYNMDIEIETVSLHDEQPYHIPAPLGVFSFLRDIDCTLFGFESTDSVCFRAAWT